MPDSSLRARLGEVADLAGDAFDPPGSELFAARRRRHYRTGVTMAAAAVLVVIVAVAATLIGHTRSSSTPSVPAAVPPPVHGAVPPGHVTVAQLANYRWSALPAAPIAPRVDGAVGVWTGDRVIVWGGTSASGRVLADGASYDPVSRTWHMLASSPLEPRTSPADVWTGTKLFIWGGLTDSQQASLSDGATYDPATDRWHRLPPLNVPDGVIHAVAVWTGSRVLLFTAPAGLHVQTVAVHAYDPAADAWTTLPAIHTRDDLLELSAVVAGNRIYAWMPVQTIAHGGLYTGNEGYLYRPRTNSWASTNLLPTQPQYSVGQATTWTGDHIIFEPYGLVCSCGGIAGASTGSWADPSTGHVTQLPGPEPFEEPFEGATYTWTGAAILATSGRNTAVWDPTTNHWTKLDRAPYQPGQLQVWTGTRLLVFGQRSGGPAGLQFAP